MRDRKVRVDEEDLSALKTAKSQLQGNPPLGLVARLGAQKLIAENEDESEVRFA